jgi:hypothetical protein
MKSKNLTHSTRIHGKSRLEVALEKSIANELKIRSLRKDLCALSLEFAQFRKATVPLGALGPNDLRWLNDTKAVGEAISEVSRFKPPGVYS